MHLAVFSHKVCFASGSSPSGYATDGGFPLQMKAISELFSSTSIVVPSDAPIDLDGLSPLYGHELKVVPLSVPRGKGLARKLRILPWILRNGPTLLREVRKADAIHAPIPGDVGTIGMILALLLRKPLFVRHCGNWLVQRTFAEHCWKWAMERFAGGNNVMFATGGSPEPPSRRNPNVKWIFATSLHSDQLVETRPAVQPLNGNLRMIIACRQEEKKGTDIVIDSLPLILEDFPQATLDVVGGGSQLAMLKQQTEVLRLQDRVTFHGKVRQAKVLELLQGADLFCYPTAASEGFPKVVLEALANGLPVITTKVSVLPQLIGSDCGVLLDDATPQAMAAAVREIYSDGVSYCRMSTRAIEKAKEYTLEKWRDHIGEQLRGAWNIKDLSATGWNVSRSYS